MADLTTVVIAGGSSIAGAYLAIIGVYKWVSRHMSEKKKHPCSDDLVYEDVCEERGRTNRQAHEHLKEGIEAAITRSDEQHVELKNDMKAGFTRIETLIQSKT